jgi:peptidoglycan hydrolase-like protein with peptidoglycan-binding domain
MSFVKPLFNESPAKLARRIGTSVPALFAANRHKPTTVVAGKLTWKSLHQNESLNVPQGALGFVGAVAPASPSAPHAMIQKGSSAAADVALWQTIIGVTPDGSFGPNTDKATRAWQSSHGLTPDGVVGPKTWAAALGSSAGPAAAAPSASATPTAPPSGLTASARAAAAALAADSNYCVSVGRVGTAVNTAVHNFKSAWNSANPSRRVPIGTGKYEPVVASALSETLGGATVPPGCGGAAAPAPSAAATPAPTTAPAGSTAPISRGAPAAVQALLTIDPCLQGNASIVTAAQVALGVGPDGKYGSGTAAAARRVLPNAPAACSPRPSWWTAPGQSNASSGASQAASAAQSAANTAQAAAVAAQNAQTAGQATQAATTAAAAATAAATAAQNAAPDQKVAADAAAATAATAAQAANTAAQQAGGGSAITPPDAPKKLSTGAIVAGAVGVAALVGVAAMAMSGKKGGGRRRASGGHKRKTSKRKPSHGKRKSKKRK